MKNTLQSQMYKPQNKPNGQGLVPVFYLGFKRYVPIQIGLLWLLQKTANWWVWELYSETKVWVVYLYNTRGCLLPIIITCNFVIYWKIV